MKNNTHPIIRPIQLSDVPRVAEIHVFGWRSAYRGIVSDEHLFKNMLVSNRIKRFENSVLNKTEEIHVYDDGIVKAWISIGTCRDEDKTAAFELGGIYVDPFMQRQGIGAKMVTYCEELAASRGYNEICLWTFEKNLSAQAFYEKMGYVQDGATKLYENFNTMGMRYTKILEDTLC